MKRFAPSIRSLSTFLFGGLVVICAVLLPGCASNQVEPVAGPPVVFPLPPNEPRVQFLGSISSPEDLPSIRSGFADFVLGLPPTLYPLAKPIYAKLRGNQLYVCDTILNSVLVYDLVSGDAHPLAGDHGTGKIQQPNSLDFDDEGRIYVADRLRQAILVYNADETFAMALGHPGHAKPVAVVVAGDELIVCDRDEHEIEIWNRRDGAVLRRFGGLGKEPGQFLIPTALALDGSNHLYVTDTGNFRVQKLTLEGEPLATFGGPGRSFGKFAWPKGLDVDGHGRLYVADSRFANVQIFDPEGHLLLFFGGPGPEAGNMDLPAGLSIVPWPNTPWLREKLMPGFDAESLVIAVSQQGQGLVNFFAIARDEEAQK